MLVTENFPKVLQYHHKQHCYMHSDLVGYVAQCHDATATDRPSQ